MLCPAMQDEQPQWRDSIAEKLFEAWHCFLARSACILILTFGRRIGFANRSVVAAARSCPRIRLHWLTMHLVFVSR